MTMSQIPKHRKLFSSLRRSIDIVLTYSDDVSLIKDVKARIGHRRPNRLVDSSQTQSSILSSILPIRFTSIFSEPMKRPTTTTTTTITTAVVAPFGDEKKNPFEDGRSPESAQMEASAPSKAEAEAEALSPSAEEEELRRHRRRRRLYKETSTAKDITKTSTPSLI